MSMKSFSGAPEDHRASFVGALKSLHRYIRQAEGHYRAGRCKSAAIYHTEALEWHGRLQAHRKELFYADDQRFAKAQILAFQRMNGLSKALHRCLDLLPGEARR